MPQDNKSLSDPLLAFTESSEAFKKPLQFLGRATRLELTGLSTSPRHSEAEPLEREFSLAALPERNVLLFSTRRRLFHQLDEGLRDLRDANVDLDWISQQDFVLDSIHSAEYDLFFLDISFFSSSNTDEKLKHIARLAAHPATPPIILISDKDNLRLTLGALHCGVVDYLFRDELAPKLLLRMLQYASSSESGKNEIFDRRRLPDQKSITSALEYSLQEELADTHDLDSLQRTIPLSLSSRRQAIAYPRKEFHPASGEERVLQNLPLPVVRTTSDGIVLFSNTSFQQLFRRDSENHQHVYTLQSCGIAPKVEDLFNFAKKNGTSNPRLQLETNNGRAWFEISVSQLERADEFLLFFQDVTEHIRAQQALKVSESRLRTLVQQLPVAIWTIDCDLRLYLSNKVAWLPAGLRKNRALSLHDLFETEDPNFRPILLARKALQGESVSMQITIAGVEYLIQMEPNRDRCGRIIGAVGVTVNMSERLALQQRREQHDKFESLSALARGIAHDFNNLLVSIVGNAGLISLELPHDSPARTRLSKITRAAECASDFTAQLLAYSGNCATERESVQVSDIAEEILDLLLDNFQSQVIVDSDFSTDLPDISADPTQIRQLALNLIKNAADALGQKGGHLRVATELRRPSGSNSDYVCLVISDSGVGFDEKTKRRIFDPFFSTKAAGRGLGLASVLGIVKGHQAKIEVDSVPHEGTTFRVFFPIQK